LKYSGAFAPEFYFFSKHKECNANQFEQFFLVNQVSQEFIDIQRLTWTSKDKENTISSLRSNIQKAGTPFEVFTSAKDGI